MGDVSREGRTILFVSHNLEAVQRLCSRGLLLQQGRLVATGPIDETIARYRASGLADDEVLGQFNPAARRGTNWARFTDIRIMNGGHRTGRCAADDDLVVEMDIALAEPDRGSLHGLVVEVVVSSEEGHPLCSLMNVDDGGARLPDTSTCTVRLRLPAPTFVPGLYRIRAFLGVPYLQHVDEIDDALEFEVTPPIHPWRPYELHSSRGHVCRIAEWHCLSSDIPVSSIG
jgi:lipopolysaccharide transport system ATP-binding protein